MFKNTSLINANDALPGRNNPMPITEVHFIHKNELNAPLAPNQQQVLLGMGCFWGAERLFWSLDGIISTSVGYAGGYTPNPTYDEVCSGNTGHTEVVRVVFDSNKMSLDTLLEQFWERHNPTQGMRQGNDSGTQYRSAIYCFNDEHLSIAILSKQRYQEALSHNTQAPITTEVLPAGQYYFAENYHQQYLAKNPGGYCGLGGTGVCFPS